MILLEVVLARESVALVVCDALCSIPLAATLHRLAEQALEGGGGEGGGGTYAALLSAAHRGAVSALACAVSKPLLVSASADERRPAADESPIHSGLVADWWLINRRLVVDQPPISG